MKGNPQESAPANPRPVKDFLLLKMQQTPDISEGGIFLPEMSRRELTYGTVLDIGPQVSQYKQGDVVIIVPYDGIPFLVPNATTTFRFIREESIIGFMDFDEKPS